MTIIDKFLSKQANDQMLSAQKSLESMLATVEKISMTMSEKGFDFNTKETEKSVNALNNLEKAEQRVTQARAKKNQLTIQEKVLNQESAAMERLKVRATNENINALSRTRAAYELASRELANHIALGSKDTAQTAILTKNMEDKRRAYFQLAQASQVVGKSTSRMGGSMFALTQILREGSNFAIDARIGFMSLSNNIPMLLDGLKLGAKAMLGLNIVAVAVSTLLVVFSKQIGEFFTKMVEGARATDILTQSTKALKKAYEDDSVKGTISKQLELKIALDKSNNSTEDADHAVKLYNETLGVHYGKVNNVRDAMAGYIRYSKTYVSSIAAQTAAMKVLSDAAGDMGKLAALRLELSNMPKATENAWNALARRANALKIPFNSLIMQINSYGMEYENAMGKGVTATNAAIKATKTINPQLEGLIKSFKEAGGSGKFQGIMQDMKPLENSLAKSEKLASSLFAKVDTKALDTNDTSIGGVSSKSIKEITTALEAYDESRSQMVRNISELEIKTSKTTKDGVLNDYKEREDAAQYLFMAQQQLALSDLQVAEMNAEEKAKKERDSNKKILDDAKKAFNAKKITESEYNKVKKQYSDAESIIEKNLSTDKMQIVEKYDKERTDAENRLSENIRAIQLDRYADEVRRIEISEDEKIQMIERKRNELEQSISDTSKSDMVDNIFGFDGRYKEFKKEQDLIRMQYDKDKEVTDAKRQSLEERLAIEKEGTEERKRLIQELADLEEEAKNRTLKYNDEIIVSTKEMAKSLRQQIGEDLSEALGTAWDNIWSEYFERLDERKEREKELSDQRIKTLEDEFDYGLYTAEEYDQKKEALDDAQEAREKELQKKKEEAEKKKFLIEQAYALASIVKDTAVAVAANLKNPTLIPLIIASGAAQAAIVAAQTIPAFKDGGEMPYSGDALVGDGGKHELGVTKAGKYFLTPSTPTVMRLDAGTHIYPDAQKKIQEIQNVIIRESGTDTKQMEAKLDRIERAIYVTGKNSVSLTDKINFAKKYGYGKN